MTIGQRIKTRRLQLGLSIKDMIVSLASLESESDWLFHHYFSMYELYEEGKRVPSSWDLRQLSRILKVEIEYFFTPIFIEQPLQWLKYMLFKGLRKLYKRRSHRR